MIKLLSDVLNERFYGFGGGKGSPVYSDRGLPHRRALNDAQLSQVRYKVELNYPDYDFVVTCKNTILVFSVQDSGLEIDRFSFKISKYGKVEKIMSPEGAFEDHVDDVAKMVNSILK